MTEKLVIIGNGMAPGRMLEHLFETTPGRYTVTIFNAEPRVNYNRLMLSPVLSGEKTYEEIITHGDDWYVEHGVTLHKSAPVNLIDRQALGAIVFADPAALAAELVRRGIETAPPDAENLHAEIVDRVERELIAQVMAACDGVRVKAAVRLGINRNTLHKKIKDYGL